MTQCGMPLVLLGAIDIWLKDHPEVAERFQGQKVSIEEILSALVAAEKAKRI